MHEDYSTPLNASSRLLLRQRMLKALKRFPKKSLPQNKGYGQSSIPCETELPKALSSDKLQIIPLFALTTARTLDDLLENTD